MRLITTIVFIAFLSLPAWGQDSWKNIYTESAWIERDQWQRANDIISKLGIKDGSKVADIGCHEGYMTLKLSRIVGASGKVYAVDVEQYKLDKLKGNLEENNINNVITIRGNYDNPKLPADVLDAALIIDTYHEMDDHDEILLHVKNSLKIGGRLVICEPIAEDRRKSLREDQERKHELGMNYALADLQKAGFIILFKQDPYIDRVKIKGDKMWLIVAQKK